MRQIAGLSLVWLRPGDDFELRQGIGSQISKDFHKILVYQSVRSLDNERHGA
jgi:hypothetical protein